MRIWRKRGLADLGSAPSPRLLEHELPDRGKPIELGLGHHDGDRAAVAVDPDGFVLGVDEELPESLLGFLGGDGLHALGGWSGHNGHCRSRVYCTQFLVW